MYSISHLPRPPSKAQTSTKKHPPNQQSGFSMIEILLVVAIVGIIASIGFVQGRRLLSKQTESSTISAITQTLARGSSAASARGEEVILRKSGNKLFLVRGTDSFGFVDIPPSVTLKTKTGVALPADIDLLSYSPKGLIDATDIANNFSPLQLITADKSYNLSASIIGDMKVETQ